jgi:glycosyltransferase involved in cell wall biosynthesis
VPKQRLVFVADSRWLADHARSSSLLQDRRTEAIHYGIDTRVYRPGSRSSAKDALGLDPAETVVLFGAANVAVPRKGFPQLKEAIEGSASLRRCMCISLGQGHVRFAPAVRHRRLGQVDSDELLAAVYRAADVFVMPSLEEAFGQTALEATACGTPTVAFAAGGVPEVIPNGVNGLTCPPGDVLLLRRLLERVVEDARLRERLGAAGPELVQTEFSYARNARDYLALYETLLGGPQPP